MLVTCVPVVNITGCNLEWRSSGAYTILNTGSPSDSIFPDGGHVNATSTFLSPGDVRMTGDTIVFAPAGTTIIPYLALREQSITDWHRSLTPNFVEFVNDGPTNVGRLQIISYEVYLAPVGTLTMNNSLTLNDVGFGRITIIACKGAVDLTDVVFAQTFEVRYEYPDPVYFDDTVGDVSCDPSDQITFFWDGDFNTIDVGNYDYYDGIPDNKMYCQGIGQCALTPPTTTTTTTTTITTTLDLGCYNNFTNMNTRDVEADINAAFPGPYSCITFNPPENEQHLTTVMEMDFEATFGLGLSSISVANDNTLSCDEWRQGAAVLYPQVLNGVTVEADACFFSPAGTFVPANAMDYSAFCTNTTVAFSGMLFGTGRATLDISATEYAVYAPTGITTMPRMTIGCRGMSGCTFAPTNTMTISNSLLLEVDGLPLTFTPTGAITSIYLGIHYAGEVGNVTLSPAAITVDEMLVTCVPAVNITGL